MQKSNEFFIFTEKELKEIFDLIDIKKQGFIT